MDIFNKKKVKALEQELVKVRRERSEYLDRLNTLELKFNEMGKLEESIPESCVRGPWCKACEFVRTFHYIERYSYGCGGTSVAYVCSKGKSCEQFVQMQEEDV